MTIHPSTSPCSFIRHAHFRSFLQLSIKSHSFVAIYRPSFEKLRFRASFTSFSPPSRSGHYSAAPQMFWNHVHKEKHLDDSNFLGFPISFLKILPLQTNISRFVIFQKCTAHPSSTFVPRRGSSHISEGSSCGTRSPEL